MLLASQHPNREVITMGTARTGRTDDEHRAHLLELVRGFDTGFLVTHSDEGQHGRPMGVARVSGDGKLFFCTAICDPKSRELAADSSAGVYFQGRTRWIALAGHALVFRDPFLVDELWKDSWKLWFPRGKDDCDLGFVRFEPTRGEYWDQSGRHSVRFALEAARARLHHRAPDVEAIDEHARVTLAPR
jgi:general stress protein 26